MAAKSKLKMVKDEKSLKSDTESKELLTNESKRKILNSISIKITVSKEKIKVKLAKYMGESDNKVEEFFISQNTGSEVTDLTPSGEASSGEFSTVSFLEEMGASNVSDESVNGSEISDLKL